MFICKLNTFKRLLFLVFFLVFGYTFSQDQGPNEVENQESIAEKDAREEKEIKELFFNDSEKEENTSTATLQTKNETIEARLEALKESILQLQLEQKRIELLLLEKEKHALVETFSKNEDVSLTTTSTLSMNQEAPQNANDLRITPTYSEEIKTYTITPDSETISHNGVIPVSKEDSLGIPGTNTYLLKETIETDNLGALKIHRVFVEKIGEEEADQALKMKTKTAKAFQGAKRASVASTQKVRADFNGDRVKFYAHISSVDIVSETTTIHFENENCNPLVVYNAMGGSLSSLSLPGSDRDFLLFSATINENEFTRYFLFVLRNNQWKQVLHPFAIHKSNQAEIESLIGVDPTDSTKILHYYSVFDLEESQTSLNPWKLKQESVSIQAW